MRFRGAFVAIAVVWAAVGPYWAQRAATAPEPAEKRQEKERKVILKSPTGVLTYQNDLYTATDATLELPDSQAVVTASRIEYNDEEQWAKATGQPCLRDERNELTARTIRVDLKAKRADAEGEVRLVARPKEAETESGRKIREKIKEPVVITCDKVEYFYRDKQGTATGNLKILYKAKKADWTATGTRLSYNGKEETLTLEGDVQFSNTRGEGGRCEQVTVTMKEGAEGFVLKGIGGEGITFFVKEREEEKPASDSGSGEKKPTTAE